MSSCCRRIILDPLSREDVEVVAKRALGPSVKVLSYHLKSISEDKIGFMGTHRQLVVNVRRDDDDSPETYTFFVKGIPRDNEEQAALIQESRAFRKEVAFYEQVAPELMSGLRDKSWSARCYLVKEDTMIFEDLKSRNFTLKPKILDLLALKSALTALAKLHASSLLAEKRLGCCFYELYPDLLTENIFVRDGRFGEFYSSGVEAAVALAKFLGLDHECVPAVCDRIMDVFKPSTTRRNVVCHGDAWSYNLMFDDSKPMPKCILVDFQLLRYVPSTADVAQLLYLTTRRRFRDEFEQELLRHYHEVLCETLRDNEEEIELPELEEVLEEYEEMRVAGAVTAMVYLPINLIESKRCVELTKDSDGFSQLIFKNRDKLVLDTMRNDPIYRERLIEVTGELVQRSKQFLA